MDGKATTAHNGCRAGLRPFPWHLNLNNGCGQLNPGDGNTPAFGGCPVSSLTQERWALTLPAEKVLLLFGQRQLLCDVEGPTV